MMISQSINTRRYLPTTVIPIGVIASAAKQSRSVRPVEIASSRQRSSRRQRANLVDAGRPRGAARAAILCCTSAGHRNGGLRGGGLTGGMVVVVVNGSGRAADKIG